MRRREALKDILELVAVHPWEQNLRNYQEADYGHDHDDSHWRQPIVEGDTAAAVKRGRRRGSHRIPRSGYAYHARAVPVHSNGNNDRRRATSSATVLMPQDDFPYMNNISVAMADRDTTASGGAASDSNYHYEGGLGHNYHGDDLRQQQRSDADSLNIIDLISDDDDMHDFLA